MVLQVLLLLALLAAAVHSQECYDDGNEFCIDQNDILAVDLLPGSFLLMDQYYHENMSRTTDTDVLADGSFVQALDEMEYHRYERWKLTL